MNKTVIVVVVGLLLQLLTLVFQADKHHVHFLESSLQFEKPLTRYADVGVGGIAQVFAEVAVWTRVRHGHRLS